MEFSPSPVSPPPGFATTASIYGEGDDCDFESFCSSPASETLQDQSTSKIENDVDGGQHYLNADEAHNGDESTSLARH